jgi:polar amino acid transport system substrate-binding protein
MAIHRPTYRLALILVALVLGACQSLSPSPGHTSARLPQILSRGALRVGLTGDQPPLNMKARSGQLEGMEVHLATALAASMGVRLELVQKPFPDLLPALQKGDVDVVISGVTITPERNTQVAFAGPYFVTGKSILTKQSTLKEVQDARQLDDPQRTYVTLGGSTSEIFVKTTFPKAKLVTTENYEAAVQMVINDKADAMVGDFLACGLGVWRNPNAGLFTPPTPFTTEAIGIALPADDFLFVNLVQNYLTMLQQTGLLTQLQAKWLTEGSWLNDLR